MTTSRKLKSPYLARRKNVFLAIGLVALSVAGVWVAIEGNNRTDEFLVSAQALPAGSSVTDSMFEPISANLGLSSDQYLRVGELPMGSYLLGPVVPGQLIIKSMLASDIIDARVPLVITSKMPLPTALGPVARLIYGSQRNLRTTPLRRHMCWCSAPKLPKFSKPQACSPRM